MWQLSFATSAKVDHQNVDVHSKKSALELQQEALQLTQRWQKPVQQMIQSTPVESIWSSPLYDSDPVALSQALHQRQKASKKEFKDTDTNETPAVVFVGDALHAMSPFKGQGANQSLRDGKTIAKWIIGGECATKNRQSSASLSTY